ncbi:MAG: DUF4175 family protein [Deltaproteobacteria bacterium]|nr:DUF4175 family protein [Deltaproteobacteria bacterium]
MEDVSLSVAASYKRMLVNLDKIRQRLVAGLAVTILSDLALVVSVFAITGTLLHLAYNLNPPAPVRAILSFAMALCLLIVFVFGLRKGLGKRPDMRTAAEVVARKVPQIDSDCLSSIELFRQDPANLSDDTRIFVNMLFQRTARASDELDPGALVPFDKVRLHAGAAVVALSLYIGLALLLNVNQASMWHSVLYPFKAVAESGPVDFQGMLGDMEARLDYPDYTGLPSRILKGTDGNLVVPVGTRVTLSARTAIPLKKAGLILPGGDKRAISIDGSKRGLKVSFVALKQGNYKVAATSYDGRKMVESRGHRLYLVPDRVPNVEILKPLSGKEVQQDDMLQIDFRADDDYGISRVDLVMRRRGASGPGKEQRRKLMEYERRPREVHRSLEFDLAKVELEPGDDIVFYLEVFDSDSVNGPKSGRSNSIVLKVYSPRNRHEQYITDQEELRELALKLLAGVLEQEQGIHGKNRLEDPTGPARLVQSINVLTDRMAQVIRDSAKDPLKDDTAIQVIRRFAARLKNKATLGAALATRSAKSKTLAADYFRFLLSLDPVVEKGIIDMTDSLDRQRYDQALASAEDLRHAEAKLKELLKQYMENKDPAVKARLRAEIEKLKRRLAQVLSQLARTTHQVADEFLNPDALESRDMLSLLGKLDKALNQGDEQGARRAMDDFERELENTLAMLEAGSATLADAKFKDAFDKMEEISSELAELEGGEREVSQRLDDLVESYRKKALPKGQDAWKKEMARLAKMAGNLVEKIEKLGSRAGDIGAYPLYSARERASLLHTQIRVGQVVDAIKTARDTMEDIELFREALGQKGMLGLRALSDTNWSVLDRQSGDAAELAEKILRALEKLKPAPASKVLSAKEKSMAGELKKGQVSYKKRATKLSSEMMKLISRLPGIGEEPLAQLSQARYEMSSAQRELAKLGLKDARDSVERVVDRLARARTALQNLRQSMQMGVARSGGRVRPGSGRFEKVNIPRPEDYRVPKEFREDLLEAMKRPAPKEYKEMIKKYYEELVK